MKTVVVTGASGFVGREATRWLVASGYQVHALGRREIPSDADVCFHRCDLMDAGAVSKVLHRVRPSHLLHLAWDIPHGKFWTSVANLDWVVASLRLVLSFAEAGGQRAVCAGTCAEYRWGGTEELSDVVTPLVPATLYGEAKLALYRLLTAASPRIGVEVAWGRIFFLYGPHEHPGRLVPQIINALLTGAPFEGTRGDQVRDFMHVSDVARAFVTLLGSDFRGAVNIASGRSTTLGAVAHCIAEQLGRVDLLRLGELSERAGDPSHLVADTSLLSTRIGFTPHFDLRGGLAHTIAWWREQRAHALEGPRTPVRECPPAPAWVSRHAR